MPSWPHNWFSLAEGAGWGQQLPQQIFSMTWKDMHMVRNAVPGCAGCAVLGMAGSLGPTSPQGWLRCEQKYPCGPKTSSVLRCVVVAPPQVPLGILSLSKGKLLPRAGTVVQRCPGVEVATAPTCLCLSDEDFQARRQQLREEEETPKEGQ